MRSINDVNIGNEVTFRSTNPSQPDYDLPWTVHAKSGDNLLIHLDYIGKTFYWQININEVVTIIPTK